MDIDKRMGRRRGSGSVYSQRSRNVSPLTGLQCQCLQGLLKALHGRVDYACADLSYPRETMGDACINDRGHIETAYLTDVNAEGHALEIEGWYAKKRVTGDGDVIHFAGIAQGISRRSPNKLYNGWGTGHSKGSYAAWLCNGTYANLGIGVFWSIAGKVQALDVLRWSDKPALSQATDENAQIDAITRHRYHAPAARYICSRQCYGFGCCHRGVEVKMVVASDKVQGR